MIRIPTHPPISLKHRYSTVLSFYQTWEITFAVLERVRDLYYVPGTSKPLPTRRVNCHCLPYSLDTPPPNSYIVTGA